MLHTWFLSSFGSSLPLPHLPDPISQEIVHPIVGIIFCSFNCLNWHTGRAGLILKLVRGELAEDARSPVVSVVFYFSFIS